MKNRIDADRLRAELLAPAGPYAALDVVARTGSTNADLREAAVEGDVLAEDRTVLLAEEQTAGAGRRGRTWVSPAGCGVYCSVLLRPTGVALAAFGSLAAVAGLAVLDVADALGVHARLKWPNDLLAGDDEPGKWAGILAEGTSADEHAVVLGVGINVGQPPEPVRPGPGGLPATSLAEHGARTTDRTEVSRLLLTSLHEREKRWRGAAGDLAKAGLLDEYRSRCATLGQDVKVHVTGGPPFTGRAEDVTGEGALIVAVPAVDENGGEKRRIVLAGDVVHLRAAQH